MAPLEEERSFGSLELTEIDRNVVGHKGLDGRVTWHESLLPFFWRYNVVLNVLGDLDVCARWSRRV